MSFILDALKKLEQNRQSGPVPDLLTVHGAREPAPKRRPLWPYLLVAAALINAGILALALRPWQPEKHGVPDQRGNRHSQMEFAAVPHETATPVPPARPLPHSLIADTEADMSQSGREAVTPAERNDGQTTEVTQEPPGIPVTVQEEMRDLTVTGPNPSDGVVQESADGFPTLKDLPEAVRTTIPKLTIAGHIYSNEPHSRMANINGEIFREGESVADGLTVEEITPTGVMLNMRGNRFHMRGY